MTLPTIQPTGAMSSGSYVEYMAGASGEAGWLENAMESLEDQLDFYITDQTVTDWYNRWLDVFDNLNTRVTTLNSNLNKINSQMMMVRSIINSLQ